MGFAIAIAILTINFKDHVALAIAIGLTLPKTEVLRRRIVQQNNKCKKIKGKVVYFMSDIVEHPGGSLEATDAQARIKQNPYQEQIVIGGKIRDAPRGRLERTVTEKVGMLYDIF